VSIALTNVGPTPIKACEAERALVGRRLDEAALNDAARLAMQSCSPTHCQRGHPDYKTAMAGEMVRRALVTAQSRAKA
jgi:carbon-monoxide dehydrogenase medium subunit